MRLATIVGGGSLHCPRRISFSSERRERKPGCALVVKQRVPITNGSSKSNRQYLMSRAGRQAGKKASRQGSKEARTQASKQARTHARTDARRQTGKQAEKCPKKVRTFLGQIALPCFVPKCWNLFGRFFEQALASLKWPKKLAHF